MSENQTIIEKSIEILTTAINLHSGITNPIDESNAKELFKALHAKSIPLDYHEIYHEAIKHSWSEQHAKSLAVLAEKIGNGGRVKIKLPSKFGEIVIAKILSEQQ